MVVSSPHMKKRDLKENFGSRSLVRWGLAVNIPLAF